MTQLSTSQMPSSGPVTTRRSPSLSLQVGQKQFGRGITKTLQPLQLAELPVNSAKANNILAALSGVQELAKGVGQAGQYYKRREDELDRDIHKAINDAREADVQAGLLGGNAPLEGAGRGSEEITEGRIDNWIKGSAARRALEVTPGVASDISRGDYDDVLGDPDAIRSIIGYYLLDEATPNAKRIDAGMTARLIPAVVEAMDKRRGVITGQLMADGLNNEAAVFAGNVALGDTEESILSIASLTREATAQGLSETDTFKLLLPALKTLANDSFDPEKRALLKDLLENLGDRFQALLPQDHQSIVFAAISGAQQESRGILERDMLGIGDGAKVFEEGRVRARKLKKIVPSYEGYWSEVLKLRTMLNERDPDYLTIPQFRDMANRLGKSKARHDSQARARARLNLPPGDTTITDPLTPSSLDDYGIVSLAKDDGLIDPVTGEIRDVPALAIRLGKHGRIPNEIWRPIPVGLASGNESDVAFAMHQYRLYDAQGIIGTHQLTGLAQARMVLMRGILDDEGPSPEDPDYPRFISDLVGRSLQITEATIDVPDELAMQTLTQAYTKSQQAKFTNDVLVKAMPESYKVDSGADTNQLPLPYVSAYGGLVAKNYVIFQAMNYSHEEAVRMAGIAAHRDMMGKWIVFSSQDGDELLALERGGNPGSAEFGPDEWWQAENFFLQHTAVGSNLEPTFPVLSWEADGDGRFQEIIHDSPKIMIDPGVGDFDDFVPDTRPNVHGFVFHRRGDPDDVLKDWEGNIVVFTPNPKRSKASHDTFHEKEEARAALEEYSNGPLIDRKLNFVDWAIEQLDRGGDGRIKIMMEKGMITPDNIEWGKDLRRQMRAYAASPEFLKDKVVYGGAGALPYTAAPLPSFVVLKEAGFEPEPSTHEPPDGYRLIDWGEVPESTPGYPKTVTSVKRRLGRLVQWGRETFQDYPMSPRWPHWLSSPHTKLHDYWMDKGQKSQRLEVQAWQKGGKQEDLDALAEARKEKAGSK